MYKINFNSYYIATVIHYPYQESQNLIIKPTWIDKHNFDFSYKVLNYSGDIDDVSYVYSDDVYLGIVEEIYDDGTTLICNNYDYHIGYYYFVRVQHKANSNLHTAIVKILDRLPNGDIVYMVVSYSFRQKYLKSNDFVFQCVSFLCNAWL